MNDTTYVIQYTDELGFKTTYREYEMSGKWCIVNDELYIDVKFMKRNKLLALLMGDDYIESGFYCETHFIEVLYDSELEGLETTHGLTTGSYYYNNDGQKCYSIQVKKGKREWVKENSLGFVQNCN